MYKIKLSFIFFCLFVATGLSQELVEAVAWQKDVKLQWSDFKGKVPLDVIPAATTASGISYKYSANLLHHEVNLDYEVTAYFYPSESWCRPEVCDDNVLAHEQLHFDISELYARKLRFKLERTAFTENVKQEIREIYKKTLEELKEFQEKYDWETNFSRNLEAQKKWNAQIAEALERTES